MIGHRQTPKYKDHYFIFIKNRYPLTLRLNRYSPPKINEKIQKKLFIFRFLCPYIMNLWQDIYFSLISVRKNGLE